MDDLKDRVNKFNALQLPGQPMGMHMGTSYLVSDLWKEVQRLRKDCLTLALRLRGEDPDTFAPETAEVMDRWRPICEDHIRKVCQDGK